MLGPRLVIAGTHSGVGKTTIATGLMAAFRAAGVAVRSAKVGPDFIDPGYHSMATGHHPRNLDPWLCGPGAIVPLAGRAAAGGDLLVIEGVMGLFDGAVDGSPSSTADVAALLDAPVVLVVDASAMSASVAALVRGYRDHDSRVELAGVILNRVGSEAHASLLTEALAGIGVDVAGVVGRDERLHWRDRHLGLVPVEEQPESVAADIARLGSVVAAGCDLERLQAIATRAPTRASAAPSLPTPAGAARVAVAGGVAFGFVYRDNLEALEAAGAELVGFDPLHDEALPGEVDGLYLGGGFPEVFVERLADNEHLRADARQQILAGLPTWAECGGLLWLAESLNDRPMLGVLPATGRMTDRLTLGYRTAEARSRSVIGEAGARFRGHEFHYSRLAPGGDAFTLDSRFSRRPEGFSSPTLTATYLHQHLGGDHRPASAFVAAASRHAHDRTSRGHTARQARLAPPGWAGGS